MDYSNKKINFLHSKKSVKIINRIYFGDNSQLYLCNDLSSSSKQYCLKILTAKPDDKSQNASINIEIVLLLSLANESNIVHIIDYYSTSSQNSNVYFILMEYFVKGNLFELMAKNYKEKTPFTESQIFKYLYGIANGIKSIHNNKYAHRDIRPENVLIGPNETMKICDFGSATNKYYDIINHNNRSEIIIDIIKNTYMFYRAPEQYQLYMGYNLGDKVDIYALGIILYMMLINYVPINNQNLSNHSYSYIFFNESLIGKKCNILFHNEIKKISNPYLYELMTMMLKENPKERPNINEVITYMDKYKDNLIKNYGFVTERANFGVGLGKIITSYFNSNKTNLKIHLNTIFITDNNLKNINFIIQCLQQSDKKINKFYLCLANSLVFYYTSAGIKAIYLLHYIIFHSEQKVINPQNFNIDELLELLSNIYTIRNNNNLYDRRENIKNVHITKYLISYCEFLKTKLGLLRKYKSIIESNNSLITSDYAKILNKTFIEDCLCLFIQCYQTLFSIPFNTNILTQTLDSIAYIINIELTSLFNLLYFIFIGFDHINIEKTNLEKQFIQICIKVHEHLDKLKKYRNDIHSSKEVFYFCKDINEAFAFLQGVHPSAGSGFSLKAHFSSAQNYFGIKLNKIIGKKIENDKPNDDSLLIMVDSNEKDPSNNQPNGNVINFSHNFDFTKNNYNTPISTFDFGTNQSNNQLNLGFQKNKSQSVKVELIPDDTLPLHRNRAGSGNNKGNIIYNRCNSNNNFMVNKDLASVQSNISNNSGDKNNMTNSIGTENNNQTNMINLLNDLFISESNPHAQNNNANTNSLYNQKMNNMMNSNYNNTPSLIPSNTTPNLIPSTNSNVNIYNNQMQIFQNNGPNSNNNGSIMSNGGNSNFAQQNQSQNNQFYYQQNFFNNSTNSVSSGTVIMNSNNSNNTFQTPMYNTPKQNYPEQDMNNQFWMNIFPQNQTPQQINIPQNQNPPQQILPQATFFNNNPQPSQPIYSSNFSNNNPQIQPIYAQNSQNMNQINYNNSLNNQRTNYDNNTFYQSKNNSGGEVFESANSQLSNNNIINIVNNYNISNVVAKKKQTQPKIDKLARDFLKGELCKPHFQFLISSKDIKLGKSIGFGGSSEVFIGNYRGTEVAVKRLRILEVNNENLKEFKREVSSLSILRHPNLVLFMGAIAEPSNICIVTEYCSGGTLFNILHQRQELILSWGLKLKILLEIATGMNFLHTNEPPIIHRDLKSLNILLADKIEKTTDTTTVKISDFGLSKIITRLDSAKGTMTGQLGTTVSIIIII